MNQTTDQIKNHYDNQQNFTIEKRRNTKSYKVKKVNNLIKSLIISNLILENDSILELGFGKGGDLRKYNNIQIKELYGIDLSNISILNAYNRALELFRRNELDYKCTLKFGDCYGKEIDIGRKFSVIISQFSFHYAFSSEKILNTAIRNIDKNLHPKTGIVLLTMPSKERIINHNKSNNLIKIEFGDKLNKNIIESNKLINNDNKLINNEDKNLDIENNQLNIKDNKNITGEGSIHSNEINKSIIEISQPSNESNKNIANENDCNKNLFGVNYFFTLVDAIDNCEEFLVESDIFISKMAVKNLKLVEFESFANYIEKKGDRRLKSDYYALNSNEKEVVNLYDLYYFQRITTES